MVYRYSLMMVIFLSCTVSASDEKRPLLPKKQKKIKKPVLDKNLTQALNECVDQIRQHQEVIKAMKDVYPRVKNEIDEKYKKFITSSDENISTQLFWEEYNAAEYAYQKQDFIEAYAAISQAHATLQNLLERNEMRE